MTIDLRRLDRIVTSLSSARMLEVEGAIRFALDLKDQA
jgi:hypothetical protein